MTVQRVNSKEVEKQLKKHEFLLWEQTTNENEMNGVLWAWVLKKAWEIDMKVHQKKEFDRRQCRV